MRRRHLTMAAASAAVAVTAGMLVGAGVATPTKSAPTASSATASAHENVRAPKTRDARAIRVAALRTLKPVQRKKFRVVDVALSKRTPFWGKAALTPKPRYVDALAGMGTHMVLVKSRVDGRWMVVDNDQGEGVGCGIAPMKILDDLYGGAVCVPAWRF